MTRVVGAGLPTARSWLFVPGGIERFVAKLSQVRPDVAILDLEDGLAVGDLAAGRSRVSELLEDEGTGVPVPLAVRCHSVGDAEFEGDMQALGPRLATLVVPKVGDPSQVVEAAGRLADAGLGHVPLTVIIESALGVERAFDLFGAHPAVRGAAFGGEDFAADLGLPPDDAPHGSARQGDGGPSDGKQAVLDTARARIVTAAAARGLNWVVDTPTLSLHDESSVEQGTRRSRSMGFTGKFAIHPAQVAAIAAGFVPSAAEVSWARTVMSNRTASSGATKTGSADVRMVDEAVVRQARRVLEGLEE